MANFLIRRLVMAVAALLPLAFACGHHVLAAEESNGPCSSRGVAVLVLLEEHSLLLCSDGKSEKDYAVSLGKGGTGKKKGIG